MAYYLCMCATDLTQSKFLPWVHLSVIFLLVILALVVQWIELRTPNARIQVRLLARALAEILTFARNAFGLIRIQFWG